MKLPLLLATYTTALHPFQPRGPPTRKRPHFDGWCIRASENEASASVIVGCFSRGRRRYDTHLVIVAQRTREGGAWRTRVAQQFYDDNECSLTTTGEGFRFTAPAGVLEASPSSLTTNFDLGSVQASISTGQEAPWNPEGWLGSRWTRWLLPCRYAVRLTNSKGTWNQRPAFVHAEAQYGARFPKSWRWVQATDRDATLVATGGAFEIGPLTTNTWLCRYEVDGSVWSFRTTDPRTSCEEVSDEGEASLRLVLRRSFGGEKRRLELTCTATPTTFSEPLYYPTREGFSNSPGSRESFASTVRVKAEADGHLIDERIFEGACLEFGGA